MRWLNHRRRASGHVAPWRLADITIILETATKSGILNLPKRQAGGICKFISATSDAYLKSIIHSNQVSLEDNVLRNVLPVFRTMSPSASHERCSPDMVGGVAVLIVLSFDAGDQLVDHRKHGGGPTT